MGLRDRLRRRPVRDDRYGSVVVVFTLPEKVVSRLDIRLGPCVPRPGTSRPMVGVTRQQPGDPAAFERLASVLLGQGAEAWGTVTQDPPGRLAAFSAALVEAMAELNGETLRRQQERPDDFRWIFERERRVLARWMPELDWDLASDSVPDPAVEFMTSCAWARVSLERGQALYCWSGPGFNPWVTPERIGRLSALTTEARGARPRR